MKKEQDDESLFNVVHLPSEIEKSNFLGRFVYLWQWRFYCRNHNKQVKLKDIPRRRKEDDANRIYNEFEQLWQDEVSGAKKNGRKANLFWPIMRQYGFFCFILSIVSVGAQFAILTQALSVGDLIRNTNKLKEDNADVVQAKTNLMITSGMMILLEILFANLSNIFTYNFYVISMKVRVSLSCLIYRKSLKLSKSSLGKTSTGQIVNFLSNDLNSVYYFFNNVSYPIVSIFMLVYSIYRLWDYMSWYTINGVLLIIFVLPVQSIICKIYSRIRLRGTEYTDERLLLLNEFLQSINLIKLYCWENEFVKKINDVRKREVDKIRKSLYLYSFNMGLFYSVNKVVVYVILVLFSLSGGVLTDEAVFSSLSVLNTATYIICIYVPLFFLYTANFWVSIKRISAFLNLEERHDLLVHNEHPVENNNTITKENFEDQLFRKINEYSYTLEEESELKDQNNTSFEEIDNVYDISIKNLTACYSLNENDVEDLLLLNDDIKTNGQANICEMKKTINVLKNINFNCKPNELVIVVGPVGSGKSSLLQAILSELLIREGNIEVNGKLSYAGQEPWTFAGTIRENILFDSEFVQEKYDEVIKVCALERDLTLFQDGDQTFIGERGVALSGGQKARINLARSLYFDADIYLLDDPLSAVDAHVSKHLFKKAINDYLKNKTVILVTHQLNFVKHADKVLFIKDGKQVLFDQAKTVMKKLKDEPDSEFAKFLGTNEFDKAVMLSKIRRDSTRSNIMYSSSVSIPHSLLSRRSSLASENLVDELIEMSKAKDSEKNERKMQEDDDKVYMIAKAYGTYFNNKYIACYGPLLFIAFSCYKFFTTSCDYFLKLWTESIKHKTDSLNITSTSMNLDLKIANITESHNFIDDFDQYDSIKFYSMLIGLVTFFSLCRSVLLFVYTMKTSVFMHNRLFQKIVRARMSFFYNNSVGVLLNKFSRDVSVLDDLIPYALHDLFDLSLNGVVLFLLMAFSNIYLAIPFIIFITIVVFYRNFFIRTARTLESLEGAGKSPVIQHLTSTLNGLSTVRAFKTEEKFINKFNRYLNDHTSIYFMTITSKRWLVYVLDNLKLVFMSGSLFILTMFAEEFTGSLVGLITAYIINFNYEFQWLVIKWSNFESHLTSVERLTRYNELESEPPLETSDEDKRPPAIWPLRGRIVFNDVTMQYFKNETPVLKNLSFVIEDKQKIGIVGRTGAGKSSIISALFRMTEYEGEILIDNVNCKEIGLHDLRKKITIIPQEPVLFTGTIRTNLDPLGVYGDHQLWNALKVTQLDQVVQELEGGLDSKVIDNGGNFSVGQKQLICLARAVLKENRILVLDEATANCDPKTDELIQTTIRTVFKHCSILTIAHRLNTIMDSTKILVLDAGEIREFDSPYRLLQDNTSLFSSMVDANGEEQSKNLRRMAKQSASLLPE